jgi:hypothetical protein
MRNNLLIAGFVFALAALPQALFAADAAPQKAGAPKAVTQQDLDKTPPAATVDFEIEQFRLIFGGQKGKGVLHFKGKDYGFTVKGVSIGGIGFTDVKAGGTVHYLNAVEDFPGTYSGIGLGAALVKGGGNSHFKNDKGVVVSIKSKSDGLALNMGVGSATVEMDK